MEERLGLLRIPALVAVLGFGVGACSGADVDPANGAGEIVELSMPIVIPEFSNPSDPEARSILSDHTRWHQTFDRQRQPDGTRGGERFLNFHRDFLVRTRNWYVNTDTYRNNPEAFAAWSDVPQALYPEVGTSQRAAFDAALDRLHNGPFSSAEQLGDFIQDTLPVNQNFSIHSYMHVQGSQVFGESVLNNAGQSPRSTYFYQLHGLVQSWYARWFPDTSTPEGTGDPEPGFRPGNR